MSSLLPYEGQQQDPPVSVWAGDSGEESFAQNQ